MKKQIGAIFAILVFLAIFFPFGSSLPDGVEKVVENLGIEEQNTYWNGLMNNYLIKAVNNPAVSSFISGTIGIFMVLIGALFLGKSLQPKKVS
jgi:hypothetical protein